MITPINFCSLSTTPAETKLYCVKIFPTFSLSRSAGMKVLFSATKSLTFIFGFDLKIFEIDALPTGFRSLSTTKISKNCSGKSVESLKKSIV